MEDLEEVNTHKKLNRIGMLTFILGVAIATVAILSAQYKLLFIAMYLLGVTIAIFIYNVIKFVEKMI